MVDEGSKASKRCGHALEPQTHSDNREEVKREGAGRSKSKVHVQRERGRKRGRETS